VNQAVVQLKGDIARRGERSYHAYHILGSQLLAWTRRAVLEFEERKTMLNEPRTILKQGLERNPRSEIQVLYSAIEQEYLNLALRA
jgi:hypothetical protein